MSTFGSWFSWYALGCCYYVGGKKKFLLSDVKLKKLITVYRFVCEKKGVCSLLDNSQSPDLQRKRTFLFIHKRKSLLG